MSVTLLDHFRRLQGYEADANALALASLESVGTQERGHPSFTRAVQVFAHMLLARRVWLTRLQGGQHQVRDWFPTLPLEELRQMARSLDADWVTYLDTCEAQSLDAECNYASSEGVAYASQIRDILTHVYNHSTYHRGQLARLVSECGGQRAATDYILLTRRRR